jgi:hypothetical protein
MNSRSTRIKNSLGDILFNIHTYIAMEPVLIPVNKSLGCVLKVKANREE